MCTAPAPFQSFLSPPYSAKTPLEYPSETKERVTTGRYPWGALITEPRSEAPTASDAKAWANGPGTKYYFQTQTLKARILPQARKPLCPQSLSSFLIHLVFSTNNREPLITTASEAELHPYMATFFAIINHNRSALMEQRITYTSSSSLDERSRLLTGGRSDQVIGWIKTKGREFRNFHWQRDGAFPIGRSNVAALKRYRRSETTSSQRNIPRRRASSICDDLRLCERS